MSDSNNIPSSFPSSDSEWKEKLDLDSYHVMRKQGTERPFSGKYNDYYEDGSYYCKGCKTELFLANSKFNGHCGWPSFDAEKNDAGIKKIMDKSHGMIRTEIVCGKCDSHLGHLFTDGPTETGYRYCVNSVSLIHEKDL